MLFNLFQLSHRKYPWFVGKKHFGLRPGFGKKAGLAIIVQGYLAFPMAMGQVYIRKGIILPDITEKLKRRKNENERLRFLYQRLLYWLVLHCKSHVGHPKVCFRQQET